MQTLSIYVSFYYGVITTTAALQERLSHTGGKEGAGTKNDGLFGNDQGEPAQLVTNEPVEFEK